MVDNFDSFEFDHGFLIKLDADVRGSKGTEKIINYESRSKTGNIQGKRKEESPDCKKMQYYNVPLSESDLDSSMKSDKIFLGEVTKQHLHNKENNGNQIKDLAFMYCLSPIQGIRKSRGQNKSFNSFSSTPIKNDQDLSPSKKLQREEKENVNVEETFSKNNDYFYCEADLFEEWNYEEAQKVESQKSDKSLVTVSQAIELIEEAKKSEQLDEKVALNRSLDLLTGEFIEDDLGSFENFLGKSEPRLIENKKKMKEFESDFPAASEKPDSLPCKLLEESDFSDVGSRKKPLAAQKLNFEDGFDSWSSVEFINEKKCSTNNQNVLFDSDDDFEVFTQSRNSKSRKNKSFISKTTESGVCTKKNNVTPLKENENELSDDSIHFVKRRKKFAQIIESDTDSPSPKILRINTNKTKNLKNRYQNSSGIEYIDLEADVSVDCELSSEEVESATEEEYDKSFVDDGSYCSQNRSVDITAKYLESLKSLNNRPGAFKIPKPKPYSPLNVFSQVPPDTSTDYEIDSFCVNDVEEGEMELSDLEIAEKILEMERKVRKKRRGLLQRREIKHT